MAQEYYKMNGKKIVQPDSGLGFNWETAYTEDSGRSQNGTATVKPLFTVEQYEYHVSNPTFEQVAQILQIIALGKKFTFHYLSPYTGKWQDGTFYVGQGGISIGSIKQNEERYSDLAFNLQNIKKLR